jgi:hypothetical protein
MAGCTCLTVSGRLIGVVCEILGWGLTYAFNPAGEAKKGATDATGTGIIRPECMQALHRGLCRETSRINHPSGRPPKCQASTPHPCQCVCIATPPRQIRGRGASCFRSSWDERRTISKQPERTTNDIGVIVRRRLNERRARSFGQSIQWSMHCGPFCLRTRPDFAPKQAIRPRPSRSPIIYLGGCPPDWRAGRRTTSFFADFSKRQRRFKSDERAPTRISNARWAGRVRIERSRQVEIEID